MTWFSEHTTSYIAYVMHNRQGIETMRGNENVLRCDILWAYCHLREFNLFSLVLRYISTCACTLLSVSISFKQNVSWLWEMRDNWKTQNDEGWMLIRAWIHDRCPIARPYGTSIMNTSATTALRYPSIVISIPECMYSWWRFGLVARAFSHQARD